MIEEAALTKGQLRKLGALRKSLGQAIADEAFSKWLVQAANDEPEADEDSIIMANSIVNSAPIVLEIAEAGARRSMAAYMYQVSRELIGNDLADGLRYPPSRLIGELPFLRLRNFGNRMLRRAVPCIAARRSRVRFSQMFAVADLGQFEHSFSLPTSVFDEESREW